MSGQEQRFVEDVFNSNWIAPLGPHVDAFEREIAQYAGVKGAVALSSGTAAIHLALRYLGVGMGDMVFCSSLTFAASANPILYLGAKPVFIDSEPETWNMSSLALERAFVEGESKGYIPKAVIIINLYGQSADMFSLLEICNRYNVPVIEDAAESLGATYKGRPSGTFGKFGIYSFNGNKIITTSGGGMLISDDLEALEKVCFWATQARDPARHYQHSEFGYNYRLSNVLAAIGRGQMLVLEERVKARRSVYNRYFEELAYIDGIEFMPEAPFGRSTHWLTALTVDPERCGVTALKIMNALGNSNIESRPVWKPLHLQPLFSNCEYYSHEQGESVSERLFQTGICLPSGSNLSKQDQYCVINCINNCLNKLL
ncbi:MAG: DegT/DnrJ/EryC1/StrS family aminotransferase [Firmicutes bacterium]|nr:DegT/DnrJ/EryC1/StrS family aminotransferase [Bacillota bacterium]